MQKNVAGQRVGVQMVSASDGSAFTGTVTVYVTGDAGSQAIGSVGSGICTHEGNGYHSYAPAQSETNYDLIAFTFVGSGAVPVTVQVYTAINPVIAVPTAAVTATAVRSELGLTGSLDSAFGDIPTVSEFNARTLAAADYATAAQAAAIETDTQDIQTRLPAALVSGRIDASVGAMAANTVTASALATDAVTEIQSGLATDAALTTVAGYIDTEVAAIKAVTDKLDTTVVLDGSVYQFTANALELAPSSGGGGGTDWTADERTAIRSILGVPTSGTTPTDPTTGILDTVRDLVEAVPTATENKNAVWNAATVDHTSTGSFGWVVGLFFQLIENVTGWRFTRKALEQAPGGSITVTPLSSTMEQRVNGTDITVFLGENITVGPIVVTDSNGDPVDLSATCEIVIAKKYRGDILVIPNGSITRSGGSNNQFSFPSTGATLIPGIHSWSLRRVSDNYVFSYGDWIVKQVATKDS